MKVIKTRRKKQEIGPKKNDDEIEIVTCDMIDDTLNYFLSDRALNLGDDDYCYLRRVGSHLEIGRIKIICEV